MYQTMLISTVFYKKRYLLHEREQNESEHCQNVFQILIPNIYNRVIPDFNHV